jgi:hypothetical protein
MSFKRKCVNCRHMRRKIDATGTIQSNGYCLIKQDTVQIDEKCYDFEIKNDHPLIND